MPFNLPKTMLAAMAVVACGCRGVPSTESAGINPRVLPRLERGASQKQVETLVGAPARHEFSASRGQTTLRCVCCEFHSFYLGYYLLFTNDALSKIILPPRFDHVLSPDERGKRAVWKSNDPEERMNVVLEAPDLDRERILGSIERRYRPKGMDNALPGAIIAGIISAPALAYRATVENRGIFALAEKFDPYRVQLGMPVAEVEQLFGPPVLLEKSDDGSETRYYGSTKLGFQNPLLWVSVVFKAGEVNRVFSDDFFNYRKVEVLATERKSK
jgi:hypothetical protein